MLTVAVLGPVEATRDGHRVVIPSGKTTEVLIRLALDAGEPVRADRMIDDVWAGAARTTARNTLQSKISQLRNALGQPSVVLGGRGEYTLLIDREQVDALRVSTVAAWVRSALQAGQPESALRGTTDGLALFRGEILAQAGDGDWLVPHRARLAEIRLGLLEDQLAARLELGVGGEVIADLEALVLEHPLRERVWSSLIIALYRADRQADALAAYARVRDLLADELGLDPGPQLRVLEAQILSHNVADVGEIPAPQVPALTGNLPRRAAPMIGRDGDLEAVRNAFEQGQLTTVVGPAGVGKTRLALEVAQALRPPGGTWLIRLDELEPGSTVSISQVVAETMQIAGEALLTQRVATVQTTILFDNCEHVVETVAPAINALLDAAPRLRVLATSQIPLGIDGEHVHPLAPLSIEDSVELFATRARQVMPQFVLDPSARFAVEEVCQSLDGLPLAIELAAARAKSLSVQEIARRLPDRFALLQDPTSRAPLRRRALGAAIAWSYDLLFPDDQHGLWALSCFAGAAPLLGVEHVLERFGVPSAAAADIIARLVDRSLVNVTVDRNGIVSYRLLDSVRVYVTAQLIEAGSAHVMFAAHADWYARRADWAAATVRGPEQGAGIIFARDERSNIDSALAWSARHDPALGLRIANGFSWTWVVMGDGVAGATRLRRAGDAASASAASDLVGIRLTTSWLEASAGNLVQAQHDLDDAAAAMPVDDEAQRADLRRTEAFLRIQEGRPPEAAVAADLALVAYRRLERRWEECGTLLLAASAALMMGQSEPARRHADAALALLRPIRDPWILVHAEGILGAIARADRRFEAAARHLGQAIETAQQLGFAGQAAFHLTTLGRAEQQMGDLSGAASTLLRAISAAVECGDLRMAATARLNLARVQRAAGRPDLGTELLEQNLLWYGNSGGGDGALLTRCLLAAGPPVQPAALRAVLSEAEQSGQAEVLVIASDALAAAAVADGERELALRLLNRADDVAQSIQYLIGDDDRIEAALARNSLADRGSWNDK